MVIVQWVSLFTGLDYWTDLFATESHFYALQMELPTSRVASYIILACNASLPAFAATPHMPYLIIQETTVV